MVFFASKAFALLLLVTVLIAGSCQGTYLRHPKKELQSNYIQNEAPRSSSAGEQRTLQGGEVVGTRLSADTDMLKSSKSHRK